MIVARRGSGADGLRAEDEAEHLLCRPHECDRSQPHVMAYSDARSEKRSGFQ